MSETDELRREIAALHQRISARCAARLRIGSSLDLDTVLDEIAESARALVRDLDRLQLAPDMP